MAKIWINFISFTEKLDYYQVKSNGDLLSYFPDLSVDDIKTKINPISDTVYLIISNSDCTIKDISVPKKLDDATLRKAIPNLIEEQILSDISNTVFSHHFAVSDTQIRVVVTNKSYLDSVYQFFISHQINIAKIYPLLGLIDFQKVKIAAYYSYKNQVILISDKYYGSFFDKEYLEQIKSLPSVSATLPDEAVNDFNSQEMISFKNPKFLLSIKTELDSDKTEDKKIFFFKQLGMFLVYAIVIFLGKSIWAYSQFSNKIDDLNQKVEVLYKKLSPNAPPGLDPRLRLETELKNNLKLNKESDFLILLYYFSDMTSKWSAKQENKKIIIDSLQYQNHILKAIFKVNSPTYVNELRDFLNKSKELSFNQKEMIKVDKGYQLEFEITKKVKP